MGAEREPAAESFVRGLTEAQRSEASDVPALGRLLTELYDGAAKTWPDVTLPREVFLPYLAARLDTTRAIPEALAGVHAADLYLACACADGDARALALFETHYFPEVDIALARSRDARDDLKQVLRERLFVGTPRKIADYSGRGGLRNWLRVAALRTHLNFVARQPREVSADEALLDVACKTGDPELKILKEQFSGELKAAFAEAAAALPARDHNLLRYALVEGLGIDQVSALYGVHRATAARWLIRARRTLIAEVRSRLGARMQPEGGSFDSILALVDSGLELSLHRVLAAS
jgi:RNA polymerase sigma-70 factor (ECF subfamily)